VEEDEGGDKRGGFETMSVKIKMQFNEFCFKISGTNLVLVIMSAIFGYLLEKPYLYSLAVACGLVTIFFVLLGIIAAIWEK